MQNHGDRMGKIQRGIGLTALQSQHLLAQSQLIVAETTVFPAEHKGNRGLMGCRTRCSLAGRFQQPADGLNWWVQGNVSMIDSPTAADGATAIADC